MHKATDQRTTCFSLAFSLKYEPCYFHDALLPIVPSFFLLIKLYHLVASGHSPPRISDYPCQWKATAPFTTKIRAFYSIIESIPFRVLSFTLRFKRDFRFATFFNSIMEIVVWKGHRRFRSFNLSVYKGCLHNKRKKLKLI